MMEDFRNRKEDYKARWRDLLLRSTGNATLADRVYRDMVTDEMEARIDAAAGGK